MAGVEPPEPELTQQQKDAIELLTTGAKFGEIAAKVGIDRVTLWRWRTLDPDFIASLNRWRSEIRSEARDRLLAITSTATDTLDDKIRKGDGRLGFKVLERMQCMEPGADTPLDPYAVFGAAMDDEAKRTPIMNAFARVSAGLTPEQRGRVHELFALGVAMDNRRAGRQSSNDLLDLAGELPADVSPADSPSAPTTEGAAVEVTVKQAHVARGPGAPATGAGAFASANIKIFMHHGATPKTETNRSDNYDH